ncbi:MAG TPA: hypothetical protein VKD02_02045 [Methyloceanibacter sp.]|nr:hypothetical protein [Methyloceanibacter sp.]HKA99534.1 hypothetical protein [Methyloceanibacter sp.]
MKSLFAALSTGMVFATASWVAAAEEPADPQAGFEYAQTYRATCHAISEEKSPLPQAPRFRNVADQPGITATALQVWMQTLSAHPGAPADFQCVEGFPARTMAARARVADLSVVPSICRAG